MDKERYSGSEFNDFLQGLIDEKCFEPKEEGITKLVIKQGIDSLTTKQQYVFEQALKDFVKDKCYRCGSEISWNDMPMIDENQGLCSYCANNSHK